MRFPLFIENSRVPKWVGTLSPIKPYAFAFFVFVWSIGPITDRLRRHETVHWKQQVECLFVFQWILYLAFWCVLFVRYRDGQTAYRQNPFEIEAYKNDGDVSYLENRTMYSWVKYIRESFSEVRNEF